MPSRKIAKSPAKSKVKKAAAKKNTKIAAPAKSAKKAATTKASSEKQAELKNDETFLHKITSPIINLINPGKKEKKKKK